MAMINWSRLVFVSTEPSIDLVGEFYGLTLDTPTMILPLLLSTLLTVSSNLEELRELKELIAELRCCSGAKARWWRRLSGGWQFVIYGKSVFNHRIEAWWSILGKDYLRWWKTTGAVAFITAMTVLKSFSSFLSCLYCKINFIGK